MIVRSRSRHALTFPLLLALTVPLSLTACGDLPEPFLGEPGATARRLAVPLTPMLAVPPPSDALLNPQGTRDFADLLALSLQREDVPTLARVPHKTDWRLGVTAARKGEQVVPRYAILDPSGHEQGAIDGAPQPAAGWTAGAPSTLGQAAQDAVPKVLALMMSIRATRDRANPNSLLNRTAVLFVPEVTGAPGDGDTALTRLIRADLAQFGPLVQVTPEGADFTVQGKVVVTPLPKSQQQVEIAWTVTRPSGVVVGKVSQLNAVPAGTLDLYWGDVAGAAAQEASGGIDRVVEQFIGRDAPAVASKAGAPAGGGTTVAGKGAAPDNEPVAGPISAAPGAGSGAAVPGKSAAPGNGTVPSPRSAHDNEPTQAAGPVAGTPAASGTGTATGGRAAAKNTAAGKATAPGKATAAGKAIVPGKAAASKATSPGAGTAPLKPAKPAAN